ncbi:DUF6263 family protein [Polaribacter septentrionalilitoris]|uniref:DUF6263 family protein n=1 Tax=Polaribacter septentrionalilitoris TaxID=2494657 RepID=UPI0013575EC5|nr:DUF6263 family protein [Polaribacter septentrionalilitoris]
MKKLLVLFLVTVSFAVQSQDQESVLLRFNYNKGDSYIINMTLNQEMGALMASDMNFVMSQKIIATDTDTFDSEMKIEKIVMQIVQSGTEVNYDSSKSDDELDATGKMMKSQMGPMMQALITMKSNNLGEVIETKVEPNVAGLEDMSNQSNNIVYPKKPISVGSSWDMTKTEKGMEMKFTYTVKSITSDLVVLEITGTVSGLGKGTISGKMNIDKDSGVLNSSNIDMDMTVSGQKLLTKVTATMTKQ